MTAPPSAPRVELRGITRRFGAVTALDGVDLDAHAGEVLALVGDNGAGKSTLLACLCGVFPPDEGEVRLDGHAVVLRSPDHARKLGVEAVHQDLALCGNLDAIQNLFLGREPTTPMGLLDEPLMEARARAVLGQLGVTIPDLRVPVEALSGGQRQSLAVARAVLWKSRVVLLDEPTAALGVAQAEGVLRLLAELRNAGLAVVLVSHNLADVLRCADRILVLRQGRRVALFRTADTTREQLVAAITGVAG